MVVDNADSTDVTFEPRDGFNSKYHHSLTDVVRTVQHRSNLLSSATTCRAVHPTWHKAYGCFISQRVLDKSELAARNSWLSKDDSPHRNAVLST